MKREEESGMAKLFLLLPFEAFFVLSHHEGSQCGPRPELKSTL